MGVGRGVGGSVAGRRRGDLVARQGAWVQRGKRTEGSILSTLSRWPVFELASTAVFSTRFSLARRWYWIEARRPTPSGRVSSSPSDVRHGFECNARRSAWPPTEVTWLRPRSRQVSALFVMRLDAKETAAASDSEFDESLSSFSVWLDLQTEQ